MSRREKWMAGVIVGAVVAAVAICLAVFTRAPNSDFNFYGKYKKTLSIRIDFKDTVAKSGFSNMAVIEALDGRVIVITGDEKVDKTKNYAMILIEVEPTTTSESVVNKLKLIEGVTDVRLF